MTTTNSEREAVYHACQLMDEAEDFYRKGTRESCRCALALVFHAVEVAPTNSYWQAAACAHAASYCSDFGLWHEAEQHALRFLEILPLHQRAKVFLPHVNLPLALVYRRTGRLAKALPLLREALQTASGEIADRLRLALVWVLCELKQRKQAQAELPTHLAALPDFYRRAAHARVLAACGEWEQAGQEVKEILPELAATPLYDHLQAWYLAYILRQAAQVQRNRRVAQFWAMQLRSIALLYRDNQLYRLKTLQQSSENRIALSDSPSGPRPAGYKQCGGIGTIG